MKMHWTWFGVGAVLGIVVAFVRQKGMGGNVGNITGGFARPFQPGVRYPGS